MQATSDRLAGLGELLRERTVSAIGTAAGTAAQPKKGAQKVRSAVPWGRLAVAGAAFVVGFLAGRLVRRAFQARDRDVGG